MDIRIESLLADVLATFLASYGDAEHGRPVLADGALKRVGSVVDGLPYDRDRRDLKRLLRLLDNPVTSRAIHRKGRWSKLTYQGKIDALRTMATSPIGDVRRGFRSLKSLSAVVYTTAPQGSLAPSWRAMGYPGPGGIGDVDRVDNLPRTLAIDSDTVLDCDVVIIGSGAGGGVAAGVLADAGLSVVVLEAARPPRPDAYTYHEDAAYRHHYVDGGLSTTSDGAIAVLAGASLGGGTTINYTTSFAPPASLLDEWERMSGLDGVFTGEEFDHSVRAVMRRFGVTTEFSIPGRRDQILESGLVANGWSVEPMPRNVRDCDAGVCGFCTMGCPIGAKQSTAVTFLRDAVRQGTKIVTGARVDRVMFESSAAVGVIASVGTHALRVDARHVVVAAGALGTPPLLARSGVKSRSMGRHLRLHPVTVVWGRFQDRVDPWSGTLQARVSKQFANLDDTGYGFLLETAPVHPMLPGLLLGWHPDGVFKRDLHALGNFSPVGILLRDSGEGGRVRTRRDGSPRWDYTINDLDQSHLKTAIEVAAQVLMSAGAVEVLGSSNLRKNWRHDDNDGSAERFSEAIHGAGLGPNRHGYLSFHQMGTARMGSDPSESVVDGDCEVHGYTGLSIMDASLFPNASGVNPMITISALAHRAAVLLAEQLT